mgnify:CR=1 FL=1
MVWETVVGEIRPLPACIEKPGSSVGQNKPIAGNSEDKRHEGKESAKIDCLIHACASQTEISHNSYSILQYISIQ